MNNDKLRFQSKVSLEKRTFSRKFSPFSFASLPLGVLVGILILLLAVQACRPNTPPAGQGGGSIGSIQRVSDSLEHNQVRVSGSEQVFQNDALRLFDGGEGLLDLGSLTLRMFNDTALGGVSVDSAPGEPLSTRIFLERGGFTGKRVGTGGQAVFETPGGATIWVFGTTFFLVYDEGSGITTVGNLDGYLEIESAGSSLPVSPGSARQAVSGQPPSEEQPILFSIDDFERTAREQASPVAALDLLLSPVVVVTPEPLQVDNDPPVFGEVRVEPPEILLGSECPGADGTAQVIITITDPSGIGSANLKWIRASDQFGSTPMEQLDDQTFTAGVGPVREAGEVIVIIEASDTIGNPAPELQFTIPALFCVG